MWDHLLQVIHELIQDHVERIFRIQPTHRLSLAQEWDGKTHAVKMAIQPEGVVTGWVPAHSPWVGNGWGMVAPPQLGTDQGDQMVAGFPQYGTNESFAGTRAYDTRNPPPKAAQSAQAGEIYFVGKKSGDSGNPNLISMTLKNGDMSGGTVTINGQQYINHSAPVHAIAAPTSWTNTGPKATFKNGGNAIAVMLSNGQPSTVLFAQ